MRRGDMARDVAPHRMGVVEHVVADAHFDRRKPLARFIAAIDGTERGQNLRRAGVVERVRPVIGRHRLLGQHLHVPLQLGVKDASRRTRPIGQPIRRSGTQTRWLTRAAISSWRPL